MPVGLEARRGRRQELVAEGLEEELVAALSRREGRGRPVAGEGPAG
jgi:hypothetical protein